MSHWLLLYRRRAGVLEVFREIGAPEDPIAARFALEREHAGDPDAEIVVLTADSVDAIVATHGRYFSTAGGLAAEALARLAAAEC